MAQGLDTRLGEGGLGLSGGQARRLALARLLLSPARCWLLDEVTEGLDARTAADLLVRLDSAARGRTLVLATHKLREAQLADRLLWVEQGRVVSGAARHTAVRGGPGAPAAGRLIKDFTKYPERKDLTMDLDIVDLSRLQFAVTALYHFLFVPLTIGLAVIIAIMETVFVMTGRTIWRDMTKFWGTLFGINFAMGVATGIVMEFQFGMNWSYYSHYVGDIFGAPLAIEGLMAFFLEATFVGLFFFGWDRLSKVGHLVTTWCVALGSNFSALWILIANGWMQNPVGAAFNPQTMRMEVTDFFAVLTNPVAQAKFVHTVSAGYVTAAIFVLGVSAWYLLKGRHIQLARRSMTVATSFGLAAALSVVVLGDESGYLSSEHQKMKLAAIEAMWDTEPAPAAFTAFGFPDKAARETHYAVHIPWVMGLIGTRSLTTEIPGINDLVQRTEQYIRNGIEAYGALEAIRAAGPRARCRPRPRPSSRTRAGNWATRCCSSATWTTRARPRTRRSPRPPGTPCRPWGRCSGPSASWWGWACSSSRSRRPSSGCRCGAGWTPIRGCSSWP